MDAYSHVTDGIRYPPVLLTDGINDHRVPPASAASRCGCESTSKGGHHMMGVAKADEIAQAVDNHAVVLEHTGDPALQPTATASD